MGTACLNSGREKILEKLYFRPNSVYCAEVTRCCKTSLCTAMGLCIHCSIRHRRNLASRDMAGLRSFIPGKIKNDRDMTKSWFAREGGTRFGKGVCGGLRESRDKEPSQPPRSFSSSPHTTHP